MEKDGVKVGCVVSGAIERVAHGVVLPNPSFLFALSQKKSRLFWRMSEPSENKTLPAVNSGVAMLPPESVSPCDDANPTADNPPLHVLVAVASERIAPLDAVIVSPLEVDIPLVRTPPANVEVALVPVPCASIVPPNTDEVAPPVPVTYRLPAMPSVADGVVEPMPTFPFASIRKAVPVAVAVDVETRKSGVVASERASSDRSADGVVVLMPTLPSPWIRIFSVNADPVHVLKNRLYPLSVIRASPVDHCKNLPSP